MTLREEISLLSESASNDAVWDGVKSFFTSWAKENGLKLTPKAIESFKNNVYKTIVYYNTMDIQYTV